ncbi:MAG: hypothetical protein P8N93_07570 [Flavobacteriaceae bacterium]|jgi:hypothetical protein|nr:hypothetical protein [Flavobacteriaceae bacterium]
MIRKITFSLSLLILIGCTKDVEVKVENPLNTDNIQLIEELQKQLNELTSNLQNSQNLNNSLESQILDLQSQIQELLIKEDDIKDGFYILTKRKFWLDIDEVEPLSGWEYLTQNTGENGYYTEVINDTIRRTSSIDKFTINESGEQVEFNRWKASPVDAILRPPYVWTFVSVSGKNEIQYIRRNRHDLGNGMFTHRNTIEVYKKVSENELPLDFIKTNEEVGDYFRETSNYSFYSDSIYRTIDPYNFDTIKEAFIMDAQRNGLDISYIRDEILTITIVNRNEVAAYAKVCKTGTIELLWEDNFNVLFTPEDNLDLLKILWHELGHGVLNLRHVIRDDDLMGPGVSNLTNVDSFRESARRMFQNIEQLSFDCGFASE